MNKITPNLWFDNQAEEAAKFYASLFKDSSVGRITRYTDTGHEVHHQPAGQVMTVEFTLAGQPFLALNGGPVFQFTPAISFMVACETVEEVGQLWAELSKDGQTLMELGEYPFSKKYGWTNDRYGVSWQIIHSDQPITQKITSSLLFVGDKVGQAEEAVNFYTTVFPDSSVGLIARYEQGEEPNQPGTVKFAGFTLLGQEFSAMDSALGHDFSFNEAVSLIVECQTQEEIDTYWQKLSAVPESEQCGWLKDKYGVSWQIVPTVLDELMQSDDTEKVKRVTEAFLGMKKFDIQALKDAAEAK